MTNSMISLFFALAASILWGIGQAMQKQGFSANFPKITAKMFIRQVPLILKTILSSWVWTVGMVVMTGGMILYSYALANGDISLVQPVVNLTMVVAALVGVIFLKETVSKIEMAGIAVMLIGVVFITAGAGEPTSMQPSNKAMAVMTFTFLILSGGTFLTGKVGLKLRPEFTFAAATGLFFGLANVMGKVLTLRVIDEVGAFSLGDSACWASLLTDYPIWIVMGANLFGGAMMQIAFANGRVSFVSPVITIIANTTPIIAAIALFSEAVTLLQGFGIVLAMVGTGMLASKKVEISADHEEV